MPAHRATLPHDEAGRGPAVVLLHAGVADRSMWAEHLRPLAKSGRRVLALDLPGFGEAPVVAGEDAPWDDVLSTLDELGIERATLVGNSFGGAVTLRLAVLAPERVEGMVLVSAPVPGVEISHELRAAWDAEEDALETGDVDAAVEAVLEHWVPRAAPKVLRDRVAAMQRRALRLQLAAGEPTEGEDPLEDGVGLLATSGIRSLVTVGERDMPDFHAGAELLARTLPVVRHTVVPGAAHLAPLETPDRFRALLLEFLTAGVAAG